MHSECAPVDIPEGVEKLWHFEGRVSLLRERSFPRVYSEIILHLGPRFRDVHHSGNSGDYFPESCFGGATTSPSVIEAPDAVCCVIGIQLHATAAYRLLGFSPLKTHNITISLVDALGRSATCLAEQCYEAPTVEARFEVIRTFLRPRLLRATSANAAIEWAERELRGSAGTRAIAPLQHHVGYSKSSFVANFREHTGFAPKQYARILRFRHALELLQNGRKLIDAALTAGYYDQSHMQNEFTEFARMTPASFVSAQRFPNSMSLPESH